MGWRDCITAIALGSTLIAGPAIHAITGPLHFTKLLHNHAEVVYQQFSTTGNIVILASGTVDRPDLTVSGTYVIGSGSWLERID